MKDSNATSYIIVAGLFVLVVFSGVVAFNLLPNSESNSYYAKVTDEMNAKIESVNINNDKLYITTSGDTVEYCAKSTRTTPTSNSMCWNKIENNNATISILHGKKYYVWIKDTNGNISNYLTVNSNNEK